MIDAVALVNEGGDERLSALSRLPATGYLEVHIVLEPVLVLSFLPVHRVETFEQLAVDTAARFAATPWT